MGRGLASSTGREDRKSRVQGGYKEGTRRVRGGEEEEKRRRRGGLIGYLT
jgi:hypothetical protein